MELILQRELPHQQKAVDAICKVFEEVNFSSSTRFYENPLIDLTSPKLVENIKEIQRTIPLENHDNNPIENFLNIDIKMETGTGKTYVYTNTIYELHKRFDINKFVIVVPSLAIKAGTAQFLQDEYVKRHFSQVCGYGTEIEVGVLETQQNKKRGRSYFPSVVSDFVKGSCQNTKKIYVLLVNMQHFVVRANGLLSRDDYDYGVEGFYRPFDAIKATKPFVIIDEPHRFTRDQKAFQVILEEVSPQAIIRFGATFPEISIGRGRNRRTIKDYQNLLYDLNACESFNQNLIKGVIKEHFEPVSKREEKLKITSISVKDGVGFQHKKRDEPDQTYKLFTNDTLAVISEAFEGITIKSIGKSTVEFSNGIVKSQGEVLDVDIYMTSYQEQMVKLALERHFEIERLNFTGRTFKIKTLALFFIDDISSYRPNEDGKAPYLLQVFEKLLVECIKSQIEKLDDREAEYKTYLEASLADISACHGGYFSQDNSDTDENIAKKIDIILHDKKRLISFRDSDGNYNTLRFLFSKWTLKEGWDNPNVFTIAKLRSSGSDISKLQEVGRGLRLPVDENGNRVSNEDFLLNYIVDFTEADFAKELINQINGEVSQANAISEDDLIKVSRKLEINTEELFEILFSKKYIDRKLNIKLETRELFFSEYPEFASGVSIGKVKDRNVVRSKPVKIRKASYEQIKEFWQSINQRYLLFYDDDLNNDIERVVTELINEPGVFISMSMSSIRESVISDGLKMSISPSAGAQYIVSKPIPYNVFLKRIMRATNIPISTLHESFSKYSKKNGEIDPQLINEGSAAVFIQRFEEWKITNLQGRFHYCKSRTPIGATALSYEDGSPRDELVQGRIGSKIAPGSPSDKYLYDVLAYDSPLEHKNITSDISEVIVYGKIPRNSIAIPTITGGLYSPDFMYVVRRHSGEKEINIVIETKDVENKNSLRAYESSNIECAKIFFKILSEEGYNVHFKDQLNNKQVVQIINEIFVDQSSESSSKI